MIQSKRLTSVIVLLLLTAVPAAAQVPQLVNFQGRLVVDGTNFDGLGLFKVAIVDAAGNRTYWSNDGTSVAGSEPASAVKLPVTNGHYSVLLGDATLANMTVLPSSVFNTPDLWVRVWFDDGVNGSQLLAPDQRIAAVGYALMAANVPSGSITSSNLADGSVTSNKIANNSVTGAKMAPDSVGPGQIDAAAVGASELAADAVTSGTIANESILGEDLAANTLDGEQLSDFLELGSTAENGSLHVWNASNDVASVRAEGGSSALQTYGSDGQRQTQLYGPSWGELELHDNTPENNITATLAAHEQILFFPNSIPVPGGALNLSTADGLRAKLKASTGSGGQLTTYQNDGGLGVQVSGDSSGAGNATVYQADNQPAIALSGSGSSASFYQSDDDLGVFIDGENGGAGYMSLRNDAGSTRVALDGQSTGTGGTLRLYDASGTQTVQLYGAENDTRGGFLMLRDESGNASVELSDDPNEGGGELWLYNGAGNETVVIEAQEVGSDGSQISLYNNAGDRTLELDAEFNDGGPSRVTTGTVQITGGSDLSEQFSINGTECVAEPEPGMIVCIDPDNPGQLVPSSKSYDRTVAGIISGAGGIRPGMLMGQADTVANGDHPVALTGRVYCRMDTGNGPIAPGDLITTSDTPGHGMKVTDHDKARGAIIGKAMTRLDEGTGLVLVLVSLQ